MAILYLNGKFVEQLDAALDPLDRGVLLGDGIFETIRCEGGQLLFHVAHFSRLGRSARLMEIPWNMSPDDLLAVCQQVLDANSLKTARLRVTITRGESHAGPDLGTSGSAPTLIVHAVPLDPEPLNQARAKGWTAGMVHFPLNHRSPLAEVKTTSYQEHLFARHIVRRHGFDEGLFLNTDGLLAEGCMSNLFLVRDGTVYTPPVDDGALPGIMRLKLGLICSRLNIEYRENSLTLEDLKSADEAFMTNAIIEVMPLVRVQEASIGDGAPGPVTNRLYEEHRRDIRQFLLAMQGG